MKEISYLVIGFLCGIALMYQTREFKTRERVKIITDTVQVLIPEIKKSPVLLKGRTEYRDSVRTDTVWLQDAAKIDVVRSEYNDSLLSAVLGFYYDDKRFEFGYTLKSRAVSVSKETHYIERQRDWYENISISVGLVPSSGAVFGVQYQVWNQINVGIFLKTF